MWKSRRDDIIIDGKVSVLTLNPSPFWRGTFCSPSPFMDRRQVGTGRGLGGEDYGVF